MSATATPSPLLPGPNSPISLLASRQVPSPLLMKQPSGQGSISRGWQILGSPWALLQARGFYNDIATGSVGHGNSRSRRWGLGLISIESDVGIAAATGNTLPGWVGRDGS